MMRVQRLTDAAPIGIARLGLRRSGTACKLPTQIGFAHCHFRPNDIQNRKWYVS